MYCIVLYCISSFVVQDFDHVCMAKDEGIFSFFDLSRQLLNYGSGALSNLYVCEELGH